VISGFQEDEKPVMPIYEYVCQKCGHHLEIIQKMSDKPLSRCPECRGRLEKVISQTSFQLKGSGWYVSDYGKGGSKKDKSPRTDAKAEKTETPSPAPADKAEKKEASASSGATGATPKSD
jgi:putative FmdB family regulatory protein